MKKNIKAFISLMIVGAICAMGLVSQPANVKASNFPQTVFQDDFSADTLNEQNWSECGEDIGIQDAEGALVIQTINTGYNNSITYKGYEFVDG